MQIGDLEGNIQGRQKNSSYMDNSNVMYTKALLYKSKLKLWAVTQGPHAYTSKRLSPVGLSFAHHLEGL